MDGIFSWNRKSSEIGNKEEGRRRRVPVKKWRQKKRKMAQEVV